LVLKSSGGGSSTPYDSVHIYAKVKADSLVLANSIAASSIQDSLRLKDSIALVRGLISAGGTTYTGNAPIVVSGSVISADTTDGTSTALATQNDIRNNWGLQGNNISSGDFIGTTNTKKLVFKTNNVERVVIDSIGYLYLHSTNNANDDAEIRDRNIGLGFPVLGIRPHTIDKPIAWDIIPNGNASEYGDNGFAWLDIVDKDIIGINPPFRSARFSIRGDRVEIGTKIFNGAAKIPLSIIQSSDEVIRIDTFSNVNIGSSLTIPSALVNIKSLTKGFLLPSQTTAQRNAIPNPAEGLQVYNNTTKKHNYFDGTNWQELSVIGSSSAGWATTGNNTILSDYLGTTNLNDLDIRTNSINRLTIKGENGNAIFTGKLFSQGTDISNFTGQFGGILLQSYGQNISMIGNNAYYGASSPFYTAKSNGYANLFELNGGEFKAIQSSSIVSAGSTFTQNIPFKITQNGTVAIGGNINNSLNSTSNALVAVDNTYTLTTSKGNNGVILTPSITFDFQNVGGGYKNFIASIHNAANDDGNGLSMYINNSISGVGSTAPGTGSTLAFRAGAITNTSYKPTLFKETSSYFSTPLTSAIVEIESATKGMLIPRMTKSQRDVILNPAQGLMVYVKDSAYLSHYENGAWYDNISVLDNTWGAGKVITSDAAGNATWQAPSAGGLATADFIYNEEFTGSATLAITIANTAIANKYNVYKNGVLLPLSQYTVSGTTLTLVSRVSADEISINYIK
jgi:hypothetical protein